MALRPSPVGGPLCRPQFRSRPLGVLVVGLDDPLHEAVADDVRTAEPHELHAFDVAQDVAHDDEARALVAREVDLGDVAGDDHLRVEPEPREEHLHLLGLGFCASSRITKESLRLLPRMNANGATSITLRSRCAETRSGSSMSCSASNSGRRYGSTLAIRSPGRKPSRSPASTAGRVRMIRLTSRRLSAAAAIATARNVLPVPAGPIPNVTVLLRMW